MRITQINNTKSLEFFFADTSTELALPFIESGIKAGFPSAALDFLDISIDLNQVLIKHKSSTFYGRVKGDSMIDAGFSDGDLLIIDKCLEPVDGKIAVCFIDGDFTVKRIKQDINCIWLVAENKKYKSIQVNEDNDFIVWGMVTYIIKSVY